MIAGMYSASRSPSFGSSIQTTSLGSIGMSDSCHCGVDAAARRGNPPLRLHSVEQPPDDEQRERRDRHPHGMEVELLDDQDAEEARDRKRNHHAPRQAHQLIEPES